MKWAAYSIVFFYFHMDLTSFKIEPELLLILTYTRPYTLVQEEHRTYKIGIERIYNKVQNILNKTLTFNPK